MKKLLFVFMFLMTGMFLSHAQDIPYGTGSWNPEGLGNHRAVICVERPADAVQVTVPWRRLDKVDNKDVILIDALSNQRVKNIYFLHKSNDYGEIVFEPVSGQGTYYLYYMPCENGGSGWFPDVIYEQPSKTYDPTWKTRTSDSIDKRIARTIALESKSYYHSFYPMEVPVNQDELAELLKTQKEQDFLLFPEDRNFPVRMTETIPLRWYRKGVNTPFEGSALKNEVYAWQVGVFSPFKNLQDVRLAFSDLKSETGSLIPAGASKCINMGGIDHLGNRFRKKVNIPKGEVRSMWIITDIPANQSPGLYKGIVEVSAENTAIQTVHMSIKVGEKTVVNKGYNTPKNMSRLNWLNSSAGLDDKVVAPYTPVVLKGNTVAVLGRKLSFNAFGFPATITSSFTQSNHSVEGPDRDILSEAIRLDILKGGKAIQFKVIKKPVITLQESGAVAWQSQLRSADFEIAVLAKMECDGYVNYYTRIKAKRDVNVDDIQLLLPYEKSMAKYLMGMGKQGGYTPETLAWKWEFEYANNMLWMGDVNGGLQLKLKHMVPDWKLFTFGKTGTYRDWSNEGKGGCHVAHTDKAVVVTAYTGTKTMKANEEMILNFGLLITPFHPLDDKHWNERYYHRPDNDPLEAAKKGATVMNVHHGNKYNPYINYPFLSEDELIPLIEKANKLNIRTKLYYTVRELSTLLPELWALRHLDDEIYTRNQEPRLADEREISNAKVMFGMTGHSWLWEHLRANYDPAWHHPQPAEGIDWDMSIRTQGLSRWHNYHIEGLNYLAKKTGMRGLYLDGVGYDRDIMKRVRKTLDRAADSCLIDFHSGNAFHPQYGMNSPANNYMELFPYVNSLWLGEGYDYTSKPDYWLVEISGIPFGLYGEMLQGCGNAYRGMVYGMSTRLYGGCSATNIWELWDYFGMSGSEYIGYWDASNPVHTGNEEVLASVYVKTDKILIALGNWTDREQHIRLTIDWKEIGLDPATARIEIPEIEDLQQNATEVDLMHLTLPASKGLILIVNE